jgi:hypothetical protein
MMMAIPVLASTQRQIAAHFNNIRVVVDGVLITPRDGLGNVVEPFVVDGTTFLPVRAVAEALGQNVDWDGTTNTVYIGEAPPTAATPAPQPTPPQEVNIPLFRQPFLRVGNVNWFNATGYETDNRLMITISQQGFDHYGEAIGGGRFRYTNYVVYSVPANATRFTATLNPAPGGGNPEVIYTIHADGNIIYTSPTMTQNVSPIPINLDISNTTELKIEVTFTTGSAMGTGGINFHQYRGIENATIITLE